MAWISTRRARFATAVAIALAMIALSYRLFPCQVASPRADASNSTSTGSSTPKSDDRLVMRLDNSGGFSHGGLRIKLYSSGRCHVETYTDDFQNRVYEGTYRLDQDVGWLELRLADDVPASVQRNTTLRRVVYGNERYWVRPEKAGTIILPKEDGLRSTSLREIAESENRTQKE